MGLSGLPPPRPPGSPAKFRRAGRPSRAGRWRDRYEVNLERGLRQYRGSRCAICDVPWQGW